MMSVSGSSRRWASLPFTSTMRAPGPAASRMFARSLSERLETMRLGTNRIFMDPSRREVVETSGVAADDLVPDFGRQPGHLARHVLARVGPDSVGMREVRSPHDLVGAQLVDEVHAHRIRLVGRPALALPVFAGGHGEREILELILPLAVHAPEDVGDPADARLAQHHAQA